MKLSIKEDTEDIEDIDAYIYVSVVYYNNDYFRTSRYYYLSEIMNMCINAKDVNFDDVNNIVVVKYKDKYYIEFAGGFSADRGIFKDTYDIDKYISNVTENTCKLSINDKDIL